MSDKARKTIAVLSVSAGAGHVRAAEALRATAEKNYPEFRTVHLDVLDMVPKLFRKFYAESYIDVVNKHPVLWGYLYQKTDKVDHDSQLKRFRVMIENLNTKKLRKTLKEIEPDTVICTHFLPAELFSRLIRKGKSEIDCWVQVTDFDVHSLWIHHFITGYFAANEEVAWRMADRGIDKNSIHVTGIPIMPVFTASYSREKCAAELGIAPDKITVLMMSGGEGVGQLDTLAERLLKLDLDFQLIALAGRNRKLLGSLEKIAARYPGRLLPMGFTTTIERVMAVSDVAISKPGGLTTSECLAMELPMIVISPIPGQEERNADFILENGAGMKAFDAAGLEYRITELLNHPERILQMRENARSLGKPDAAARVLDIVVRKLDT